MIYSILQVVDALYASKQIRCTAHNLRIAGFTKYKITYLKGPTFSFKAINQLQQFILRNREAVQDPDSERPLTFHGLRHTYAAEKYRQLIADGFSELDAHLTVSRLLGHERADVTNIYLASLNKRMEEPI